MICPNKNSEEWKFLMKKHNNNEREALRNWAENNLNDFTDNVLISEKASFVVDELSKVFEGVNIIYDNLLDVPGKVINQEGVISLVINPQLMEKDTIAHEYGHIFLDTIGGLNNETVKLALQELEETETAKKVRELYSDETKEVQDKEIIINALGKEVTSLLEKDKDSSRLSKLIRGILNQIAEFFGLNNNQIKILANQMIKSNFKSSELVLDELEYSQKLTSEEEFKKQQLIDKIKVSLNSKINELKNQLTFKNEEAENNATLKKFEDLFTKLNSANADLAISDYLKLGVSNSSAVIERLKTLKKEDKIDLYILHKIKNYIDAFSPDITDSLMEIINELDEVDSVNLKNLIFNYKQVEGEYHNLGLKFIKEKINLSFSGILAFYRRKANIEFVEYAKNNNISKSDKQKYEEARNKYIEDYLDRNSKKISEEIELKKNKFLTVVDRDISFLDYWATNPRDLNNNIIQEAIKILDEADYETSAETDDYLLRAKYYYDRYVSYVGNKNDQKKLYEPILQKDEKGNTIRFLRTVNKKRGQSENSVLDPKYKGTPVEDLLVFLTESYKERDKVIPKKYRINHALPNIEKDNLERIFEVGAFQLIKGSFQDLYTARATDTDTGARDENLKESENYLDRKLQTVVNASGKEKQFIPIHYRNKIDEKDASFDVVSLMVLDMHQAFNYKNKFKVQSTLMVMRDLLGRESAKVVKTASMSKLIKEVFGVEGVDVKTPAKESLVYRALNDLIEVRLYNQKLKGDPTLNKIVQNFKSYVSLALMTHNPISGAANYIQGTSMNIIKAIGRGDFTLDDYMKARIKVSKDLPNITSDLARFHHKSKTQLLMRKMNIRSDYSPLINKFSDSSVLKRYASPFSFMYFNDVAEFNIQASNMYASMNNIKVKNKDGQYIDKEGKVVKDKKDAASIDEVYKLVYTNSETGETITEEEYDRLPKNKQELYLDGKLELIDEAFSADRAGNLKNEDGSINDSGFRKLSLRLREINRSGFGNYDGNNRAGIDRYALGTLVTHMRQWFTPLAKDRFLGGYSLFKFDKNSKGKKRLSFIGLDELSLDDIKFNENLESLQEGFYVTLLRYVGDSITKFKLNAFVDNWNKLDEYEKVNMRKSLTEITLTLSFVIIGKTLANMKGEADDEDEKQRLLVASILVNRAASELMSFWNPMEWQRIATSPAVSLGVASNLFKAASQLITEPTEVYEKGKFKGQNKAKVHFLRATPLKPLYRDLESIHNWIVK